MSFHDQQYSEKRDFMRMTVETAATLTFGADNHSCDVICRDLSNQGAQVTAGEAVAAGTLITLSIPSPTPATRTQPRNPHPPRHLFRIHKLPDTV